MSPTKPGEDYRAPQRRDTNVLINKAGRGSFMYEVVYTVGWCVAVALSPFSKKIRQGLRGRIGLSTRVAHWVENHPRPVWFHVASSGELEQAIPIMEALRVKRPQVSIFLSVFSPSGSRAIELEKKRRGPLPVPWDYADYSPFDWRFSVQRFLRALSPEKLVVINRELWPGLLAGCRERKVPCFLFAVYLSSKRRENFWGKRLLSRFDYIGTTEKGTADFLEKSFHLPCVKNLGDPRIERVLERKKRASPPQYLEALSGTVNVCLASLWLEDFEALKPTLDWIMTQCPGVRVLLIPHEPDPKFLSYIEEWFFQSKSPIERWSRWDGRLSHSALLVDRVGILAELYQVASVVFVGGSFKAKVHNVLEPAAYGCPIVTGPKIANSWEAIEMSEGGWGVTSVASPTELKPVFERLLGSGDLRQELQTRLGTFLCSRLGASLKYSEVL